MAHDSPSARLKWAREQHGHHTTATDAARSFGWKVSTYLGHENGDRIPSRDAAKRYAKAYRVRWEWLLEGEGLPHQRALPKIVIRGIVESGSKVKLNDDNNPATTDEAPPSASATTVALEVGGGAMRGIADQGWLIFFDDERKPPTPELIGKLCVCETAEGEVFVRVLQPGRKRHRYDLESPTEATIRDARLTWAARVTWLKPR